MTDWHTLEAVAIAAAVKSRKASAVEVTRHFLDRIAAVNGRLNAFLDVSKTAEDAAKEIDRQVAAGIDPGPLAGVPIAVKDIIEVRGERCTCGSKMLENYVAPFDAHVIERLRSAGAIFIGRTNLDEYAMGSSTENSAFGPTRNPWDTSRAPGGSSGGSAAAVAAGLAPLALGTETGGSVRQPASFCSVYGLKPTYGRVSRFGMVAFGSSLDQIAPFARSAADIAAIMGVMAGFDGRDSTSSTQPVPDYGALAKTDVKGLRLGVPSEYMGDGIDPRVRERIEAMKAILADAGAKLVPISLPHTKYAIPVYYIIATSEASSNLARFDGVGYGHRTKSAESMADLFKKSRMEGFGDEVKRRIVLGTYCLSSGYYDAYYEKALRVRTLIRRDFDKAFESVDAIIGPTSPTLPFKIGERADDPLAMYLADVLTAGINLAGIPGLSMPAGFVNEGGKALPVGLQIIAPAFREGTTLAVATAVERAQGISMKVPNV